MKIFQKSKRNFCTSNFVRPKISLIGIGGAGVNIVENMIARNVGGVEFIVCNTDYQSISTSSSKRKIQLGKTITHGHGAGSNPAIGRESVDNIDEIVDSFGNSQMLWITGIFFSLNYFDILISILFPKLEWEGVNLF